MTLDNRPGSKRIAVLTTSLKRTRDLIRAKAHPFQNYEFTSMSRDLGKRTNPDGTQTEFRLIARTENLIGILFSEVVVDGRVPESMIQRAKIMTRL